MTESIGLLMDAGGRDAEIRTYQRENPDKTLAEFMKTYRPRFPDGEIPDPALADEPVSRFLFRFTKLSGSDGSPLPPPALAPIRAELDALYAKETGAEPETRPDTGGRAIAGKGAAPPENRARAADIRESPGDFPETITDDEAVRIAYGEEIGKVADYLRHGLSVLIICDKMLTEYIHEVVIRRAGKELRTDDPPREDDPGEKNGLPGRPFPAWGAPRRHPPRQHPMEHLPETCHSLKENDVLLLRSLDMVDTPELRQALYKTTACGRNPQILGFLDPSLEVSKVLRDRFSIHMTMMNLPRHISDARQGAAYCVSRIITRAERNCFADYHPEHLYKNVAGLNPIQFRNAMKYVSAKIHSPVKLSEITTEIRNFKTSSNGEIGIPDTKFSDIGGYDRIKQQLIRIVALIGGPIQGMEEKHRNSLMPRGFIFHGPPGTGKTLFAKAIANEMNATIQMVSGPEIMDKYVGESESRLRRIFATARRNAPAVIFFDEFDSIAGRRGGQSDGGARANNAVVAQLLTELDGFHEDRAVLVIGTTNRIGLIDEALLRPSRFRPVEIPLPDPAARREVARIHAGRCGIDRLVKDLCALALAHAPADPQAGEDIPAGFARALFARYPQYGERYGREKKREAFVRDLRGFFDFLQSCRDQAPEPAPFLDRMEEKIRRLGRDHGADLDQRDADGAAVPNAMAAGIRDLAAALAAERQGDGRAAPGQIWNTLLDLVAGYTEDFNNDEIRAIFQEAGLDHHMEGCLITPRYLGMKIGLIRKRRDERRAMHLESERAGGR